MPFPSGPLLLEQLHSKPEGWPDSHPKPWWKYKRIARYWRWVSRDGTMGVELFAGELIDGASIPSFARSVVGGPWEEYIEAAAAHDKLYQTGINRVVADGVLLEIMRELETVAAWKRLAMTGAVMVGGWYPWYKYRGAFPWHVPQPLPLVPPQWENGEWLSPPMTS